MAISDLHHCECSACKERGEELRRLRAALRKQNDLVEKLQADLYNALAACDGR